MSDGDLALILAPGPAPAAADVGLVLAPVLGLHPTDARTRVRYSSGLLIERAPADMDLRASPATMAITISFSR